MTGIVNSTGARSGVIGTTVGTPASGPGDGKENAWHVFHNAFYSVTGSDAVISFNTSTGVDAFIGSNITYSSNEITISVAGVYMVIWQAVHQYENAGDDDIYMQVDGVSKVRSYLYNYSRGGRHYLGVPIPCPDGDEVIRMYGNGEFYGTTTAGSALNFFAGYRIGSIT